MHGFTMIGISSWKSRFIVYLHEGRASSFVNSSLHVPLDIRPQDIHANAQCQAWELTLQKIKMTHSDHTPSYNQKEKPVKRQSPCEDDKKKERNPK